MLGVSGGGEGAVAGGPGAADEEDEVALPGALSFLAVLSWRRGFVSCSRCRRAVVGISSGGVPRSGVRLQLGHASSLDASCTLGNGHCIRNWEDRLV